MTKEVGHITILLLTSFVRLYKVFKHKLESLIIRL